MNQISQQQMNKNKLTRLISAIIDRVECYEVKINGLNGQFKIKKLSVWPQKSVSGEVETSKLNNKQKMLNCTVLFNC